MEKKERKDEEEESAHCDICNYQKGFGIFIEGEMRLFVFPDLNGLKDKDS